LLKARQHNWAKMIKSIQTYIHSLNFKYRTDLRSKGVVYENSYGEFISSHRLKVDLLFFFIITFYLFFIVNRQKRSNKRNNWRKNRYSCWWKTKISKYSRR
jgi:hypothetical protein